MTKHQPKKHLATRGGTACDAPTIKLENITSIPERVTCDPCRSSTEYVDAVARRIVLNPGRRPRRARQ